MDERPSGRTLGYQFRTLENAKTFAEKVIAFRKKVKDWAKDIHRLKEKNEFLEEDMRS